MTHERILKKNSKPTDKEMLDVIGNTAHWLNLRQYIETQYDFVPEVVFYGDKYSWTLRYRKAGKTLCSLFPETGAFSTLVVLGRKETEKALSSTDKFNPKVRSLLRSTEKLRDGLWPWIRVSSIVDVDAIKELLNIKRKAGKIKQIKGKSNE